MSKILLHTEIEIKDLLRGAAHLQIKELEEFVRELNGLITRKKSTDKTYQEKVLLQKINEAILPEDKKERYFQLMNLLDEGTISEENRQELISLTAEEEQKRNERVALILELSQLRNVPFTQVMKDLGLNPIPNA